MFVYKLSGCGFDSSCSHLRNVIDNNISTDIELSKTQISKIIEYGGFLSSLLSKIAGWLMKVALAMAKNI